MSPNAMLDSDPKTKNKTMKNVPHINEIWILNLRFEFKDYRF